MLKRDALDSILDEECTVSYFSFFLMIRCLALNNQYKGKKVCLELHYVMYMYYLLNKLTIPVHIFLISSSFSFSVAPCNNSPTASYKSSVQQKSSALFFVTSKQIHKGVKKEEISA